MVPGNPALVGGTAARFRHFACVCSVVNFTKAFYEEFFRQLLFAKKCKRKLEGKKICEKSLG